MLASLTTTTTTNFSTHFSFGTPNFMPMIMFLLTLIGTYMIFQKAGEKGWKGIIPLYNDYVMCDLFWEKKYFWMQLVTAIITVGGAVVYKTAHFPVIGLLILVAVMMSAAITCVVQEIKLMSRVARAFGHGTGFTIGLVFLKGIFLMILGFDHHTYKAAC